MHKDCRGRGGKGLVTIKGSRKSEAFCKSFCFLAENIPNHHSCASPSPWLWSHFQEDTWPSGKLSAWLWPNWNSWPAPNCHKTKENVLRLLEEDSWHCLKASRAEQTSVVYKKTFEDYLKLKRKVFPSANEPWDHLLPIVLAYFAHPLIILVCFFIKYEQGLCLSVVLWGAQGGSCISETRTHHYITHACTKSLQLEWLSVGTEDKTHRHRAKKPSHAVTWACCPWGGVMALTTFEHRKAASEMCITEQRSCRVGKSRSLCWSELKTWRINMRNNKKVEGDWKWHWKLPAAALPCLSPVQGPDVK